MPVNCQLMRLLYYMTGRRAVVGIAVNRNIVHNLVASAGCHEHHVAPKLVALVNFAFGNAFDFRCMYAVELVRITALLLLNLFFSVQQHGYFCLWLW